MKSRKLVLAVGFAAALGTGTANANGIFIIDDFNVTTSAAAIDTTAGLIGERVSGSPSTEGTLMNGTAGWGRGLYAFLSAGTQVTTEDCPSCQEGRVTAAATSWGEHGFEWGSATGIDLTGFDTLLFDWSGDSASNGLEIALSFTFSDGSTVVSSYFPITTAATAGIPLPAQSGSIGYAGVTYIYLGFRGGANVTGYIGDIDNVRLAAVPEPATLALFALGLAGVLFVRRRTTPA